MEKYSGSVSMIKGYWTQGQSETMALIRWFQSGDKKDSRVRNKISQLVKKPLMWIVEMFHLFSYLTPGLSSA